MKALESGINPWYLDKLTCLRSNGNSKQKLIDFCVRITESGDLWKMRMLLVYLQELNKEFWWDEMFDLIFRLKRKITVLNDKLKSQDIFDTLGIDTERYFVWYTGRQREILEKNVRKYYVICRDGATLVEVQKFNNEIVKDVDANIKEIKTLYHILSIVKNILEDTGFFEGYQNSDVFFPISAMLINLKSIVENFEEKPVSEDEDCPAVAVVARDWSLIEFPSPQSRYSLHIEPELKRYMDILRCRIHGVCNDMLVLPRWSNHWSQTLSQRIADIKSRIKERLLGEVWVADLMIVPSKSPALDMSGDEFLLKIRDILVKFGFDARKTWVLQSDGKVFFGHGNGFYFGYEFRWEKRKFDITSADLNKKFSIQEKEIYTDELLRLWILISFCIYVFENNKGKNILKKYVVRLNCPFDFQSIKEYFPTFNRKGKQRIYRLLKCLYAWSNIKSLKN